MKLIFCTVFVLLFFKTDQTSRINLLCSKWKQVGLKRFGKDYKVVDESLSEVITINKNGSFEEVLYGNLKMKGLWKFSADSSKLSFALTEINGTKTANMIEDSKPTDSIIRLTRDTLIYGSLAYFGPEKIYGHNDWYFVRVK